MSTVTDGPRRGEPVWPLPYINPPLAVYIAKEVFEKVFINHG